MRTGSPGIDVHDRERKREKHVAESHVAILANPHAHAGDDPCSDESEDDANGRPEMSVFDRPREKGPDAHEDRERRDGDGAVAPEEFLEVDVGIQIGAGARELCAAGGGSGRVGESEAAAGADSSTGGAAVAISDCGAGSARGVAAREPALPRPQLRAQGSQLVVQRTHVLLQHRNSLFVRHRSPVGEAPRTTAAARVLRAANVNQISGRS